MTTNQNTTEVVIENILNTEEISSITLFGDFHTEVEMTVTINDKERFLSLFPNSVFDKKYFVQLVKEGVFDETDIIETKSHSLGQITEDWFPSNFSSGIELSLS